MTAAETTRLLPESRAVLAPAARPRLHVRAAAPRTPASAAAVRSGHWLIANSALTTVVGLAYWVVAARLYAPEAVGRNAAAISALMLIAGLAQLNVMTVLLRFLPTAGPRSNSLVIRGYAVAAVATMTGATLFVLAAGHWSPEFAFLRDDPWLAPWFALSAALWALFMIQDHVLTAVRRANVVTVENLAFSALKLGGVALFVMVAPSLGILLSWTASAALAVAGTSLYLFARAIPAHQRRSAVSEPVTARALGHFGLADYAGQVLYLLAATIPPLVVVHREGAEAAAGFLLAWTVVIALHCVPTALAQSAIAHSADPGVDHERDLAAITWHALALVTAVAVPLSLLAPWVLDIFGHAYDGADTALRLLALSLVPHAVIEMAVCGAQIRRRMRIVVALRAAQCLSTGGLMLALWPTMEFTGVGAAWLIAESVLALGVLGSGMLRLRPVAALSTPAPDPAAVPGAVPSGRDHGDRRLERPRVPTVSAIVCCYTERRWTQTVAAVRSLQRQRWEPDEVILVVDHNPVLLALARAELRPHGVRVIESTGAPGLAGARNSGTHAATGEIVTFLDDDAAAPPGWLGTLVQEYTDPDVVAAGSVIDADWVTERPEWFPPEFDWVVGCSYAGQPTESADVRNVFGAAMSYRRAAVIAADGFAEGLGREAAGLPMGCEETDLCIRLRQRNPHARIRYVPAVGVRHTVPPERSRFRYFLRRCWAEGLSKAHVAERAGRADALSAERTYVRQVLPRGVGRALRDRRPRRAGAILAGLGTVATAYVVARARGRRSVRMLAGALPPAMIASLWSAALAQGVDVPDGDAGLVGVLPVAWFAAFGLALGMLGWHIHRSARDLVVGGYLLAVVVLVHATPALLYPTVRYPWSWKHLGVVDYISRNGQVDPEEPVLGVYHAWPGFFSLNAMVSETTGLSPTTLARWAPVFFHLLFLAAAFVAFRALTTDRRLIWLGLAIFALGNWVGQDYFAPQPLAFFLYLVIVGSLLRFWPARPARTRLGRWARSLVGGHAPIAANLTRSQKALLGVVLGLLMAAVASSHQLTPPIAVVALSVIVLAGMVGAGWAPWAMTGLAGGWVTFLALTYHRDDAGGGGLPGLPDSIGRPWGNVWENLVGTDDLSGTRLLVIYSGRVLVAGILGLAVVSALRTVRGSRRTAGWLLVLVPLGTVGATAYGGEVVFRAYLFALPFAALLAAGVVYPRPDAARQRRAAVFPIALCLGLAAPFLFAYYGKEQANYVTDEEVVAQTWLLNNAPEGSLLVGLMKDYPWQYTRYDRFEYLHLSELPESARDALDRDPLGALRDDMREGLFGDVQSDIASADAGYVLLSRTQEALIELSRDLPPDLSARLESAMLGAADFREVFRTRDAVVFRFEPDSSPPVARSDGTNGSRVGTWLR